MTYRSFTTMTQSALSLDKASALSVYLLEVGSRKTTSRAKGSEFGKELSVIGGHAPIVSGGGRVAAKRTKRSTTLVEVLVEVHELTKVDALPSSAFRVDYMCHHYVGWTFCCTLLGIVPQ